MSDFGANFFVAPLKNSDGYAAWTKHPTAGVLREDGDTADAAVVALRARWAIIEGEDHTPAPTSPRTNRCPGCNRPLSWSHPTCAHFPNCEA